MKAKILICFVLMLNYSCNSQSKSFNEIRGFDISKNDEYLIYSYKDSMKNTFIKRYSFLTKSDTVLISPKKNLFYVNPKYSPDGKKIVFIEYNIKNLETSSLCFSYNNGASVEYLIKDKGIITEAIFSEESDKIFFLMAKNYEAYSPIGVLDSHNYDIYSYDILEKKTTKISNIDSYKLGQISIFDKENLLIYHFSGTSGGMFLFNIASSKMKKIVPINNPRDDASLYDSPIYSKKFNLMAFIAPYQIYAMDLKTNMAELVFDNRGNGHIGHISFFNTEKRILFVKDNIPYFYSIDLENHITKQLSINSNKL